MKDHPGTPKVDKDHLFNQNRFQCTKLSRLTDGEV